MNWSRSICFYHPSTTRASYSGIFRVISFPLSIHTGQEPISLLGTPWLLFHARIIFKPVGKRGIRPQSYWTYELERLSGKAGVCRDHFMNAPSQWGTTLKYNVTSSLIGWMHSQNDPSYKYSSLLVMRHKFRPQFNSDIFNQLLLLFYSAAFFHCNRSLNVLKLHICFCTSPCHNCCLK